MILLLLLFVVYTVVLISYLFRRLLINRNITRFFAEHSETNGIVVGYKTIDGHTYTTASRAVPETSDFCSQVSPDPRPICSHIGVS